MLALRARVPLCAGTAEAQLENEIHGQLHDILNRILDVTETLDRISQQPFPSVAATKACHEAVDQLVADYRAVLARVPADQQDEASQRYGRKVTQLRTKADRILPGRSVGEGVSLATGDQWTRASAGAASSSAAPKRASPPPPRPSPRPSGPTVGGDIEGWCGRCKGSRSLTIVAMVGGEPKQVLCNSCGARQGFRVSPARKKSSPAKTRPKTRSREEMAKERMAAEVVVLRDELDQATEVRPFVKRTRHRAGEIIEHPEHGRGKVEHSERGLILVRFLDGRRSFITD